MRIDQESGFALALQKRVLEGDAAPAAFQRPYVWREKHVEALWESIAMGVPIGSFLLWRPESGAASGRMLGPIALDPSPSSALVLDGQNRLATLAWSATDPETDVPDGATGTALWRNGRHLVADTRTSRVRFVDAAEAIADDWLVPMHHIGRSLQPETRRIWNGETELLPRVEWLNDLEHRLRSARIVVTTLHGDEEEARRAYLLISTAGVPMSAEDFDATVAGSRS